MQLHEAYEIMRSVHPEEPNDRLQEARKKIYHALQGMAQKLFADDNAKELGNSAFLNLVDGGTELDDKTDEVVKSYLETALKNVKIQQYRDQKKKREYKEDRRAVREDEVFRRNDPTDESEDVSRLHKSLKEPQQSALIDDEAAPKEAQARLYRFLKNTALNNVISRRPARERACRAIEQMRTIVLEKQDFDDLVREEAGPDATEQERQKARDRIHKRHQRTRDRLLEWIDEETSSGSSSSGDMSLTEHDFLLLKRAVEALRSRCSSEE